MSDRDFDYDHAAVDAYLEDWPQLEADAQYEAWRSGIGEPFDFTGESYLDEYTRPLRERTPLIDQFEERVSAARARMSSWGEWPDLTGADLEFILDLSQGIHTDGDYFLRQDAGFLDDQSKVNLCAAGTELASLSRDFWERLIEVGSTPTMVREARHLLLLRGADDDESVCRRQDLEAACMDYVRPVEKAKEGGGDMFDAFQEDMRGWGSRSGGNGAFKLYHGLGNSSERQCEELLACLVRRDRAGALRILARISTTNETEARKAGLKFYDGYEVERVPGAPVQPATYADISFLRIGIARRAVSSHTSPIARTSTFLVGRRACSRERASRGKSSPVRGSRRISSRSDGGGAADDPDPEPSAVAGIRLIEWEIATTGFGLTVGAAAGIGLKGTVIGALIGWLWGRRRLARGRSPM